MSGQKCPRSVQLLLPLSVLVTHASSDQVTAFSTELYAVQLQLKQITSPPKKNLQKTQKKNKHKKSPFFLSFPSKCKKKNMKMGISEKKKKSNQTTKQYIYQDISKSPEEDFILIKNNEDIE